MAAGSVHEAIPWAWLRSPRLLATHASVRRQRPGRSRSEESQRWNLLDSRVLGRLGTESGS